MSYLKQDYIGLPTNAGLESELNQKISRRVMEHRNRFRRLIYNRYLEFIPLLINYKHTKDTGIDFIQLEKALRYGYQVVVGKARNDVITILGYVEKPISSEDDINQSFQLHHRAKTRLTQEDITFTVPEYMQPHYDLEIY